MAPESLDCDIAHGAIFNAADSVAVRQYAKLSAVGRGVFIMLYIQPAVALGIDVLGLVYFTGCDVPIFFKHFELFYLVTVKRVACGVVEGSEIVELVISLGDFKIAPVEILGLVHVEAPYSVAHVLPRIWIFKEFEPAYNGIFRALSVRVNHAVA